MFQNLKLAFEITKLILRHFDQWVWCTPEELRAFDKSQYMYSYEYYYQRYLFYLLFSSKKIVPT